MSLVRARGAEGSHHVLLGLLRGRVAASHRSWLSARKNALTRQRHLRGMRRRYSCRVSGLEEEPWHRAPENASAMGIEEYQPADALGCGPYSAGGRRRRRMRPVEYPHAVPDLPSRSDTAVARAPGCTQASLVAQGDYRIHARGSPRRQVARNQRDNGEAGGRAYKRERVSRIDVVQNAAE